MLIVVVLSLRVTPKFADEDVGETEIWKDSSHSLMSSVVAITLTDDVRELAEMVTVSLAKVKSLSTGEETTIEPTPNISATDQSPMLLISNILYGKPTTD